MREFTKEGAQRLITKMRINYGKKFIDQWAGSYRDWETDRKSTRLNSSHRSLSRMPSSA